MNPLLTRPWRLALFAGVALTFAQGFALDAGAQEPPTSPRASIDVLNAESAYIKTKLTRKKLRPKEVLAWVDRTTVQHVEMEPYRGKLQELIQGVSGGENGFDRFYLSGSDYPAALISHKGEKGLILTKVVIEVAANSFRLSDRQRATLILSRIISPKAGRFAQVFANTDLKYGGVVAVYGVKTSLRQNATPEAEVVGLIFPVALAQKFSAGEITEDEFLDGSDIYLSPIDSEPTVKKIKPQSEQ